MGHDLRSRTLSHTAGRASGQAWLLRVMSLDDVLAPGYRWALDGVDYVALGRGADGSDRMDNGRRLEIRVADNWMSSNHAVLRRVLGVWVVIDEGSKNGTLVNGQPATRAPLSDGDLLELGNTLFRFRFDDVDDVADGEPSPILGTLLPQLVDLDAQLATAARSTAPVVLAGDSHGDADDVARTVHRASGRAGTIAVVNATPGAGVAPELEAAIARAAGGTLVVNGLEHLDDDARAVLARAVVDSAGGTAVVALTRVARPHWRSWCSALGDAPIALPTLSVRRDDLAGMLARRIGRPAPPIRIERDAARALLTDWPGTLDELAGIATAAGDRISAEHLSQVVTEPPAAAAAPSSSEPVRMAQEGEIWALTLGDDTARFRDSQGMRFLAYLVDRPREEIHALELAAGGGGVVDRGDAGPLIDATARAAYRARVAELRAAIDEAHANADLGRARAAEAELDAISDELARAVGLGGRTRRAGSAAERSRVRVTKNVRRAIARIESEAPAIGRHLRLAVRTGYFCSYVPEDGG